MASRKPKGSYTRHTTDWFLSRCAIAGVFYKPPLNSSGLVELFNNAMDGSNLHIYRLWVQTDAGGAYWVTRQTGTMGGTAVTTYPVLSSGAALPGLVNYGNGPVVDWLAPGSFVMPAFIGGDNEAGSLDTFGAAGPICVLVPGDSLQVFSPAVAAIDQGTLAVTFYWAALYDLGQ